MIKNNLSKHIFKKDITHNELSLKTGISTTTIRKMLHENKYPKYQIRAKLCKFFNITQDKMFFID